MEKVSRGKTRQALLTNSASLPEHENCPPRVAGREATVQQKLEAKRAAWVLHGRTLATGHDVYLGDARTMDPLTQDECIHLVVTSPPYWDLKEYAGDAGAAQLGHVRDRGNFLAELGKVWKRCYQLLVPGARMCIVVGDVCRSRREHGRHLVDPLHAYLLVQCQEIGFDPLAPIVWRKIANLRTEVSGNGATFLGKPYEPNAIIKNDLEYILMFRKPGDYRHPTQLQRDLSVIDRSDYQDWFQQVWEDIPGDSDKQHPATFPKELARRLISMFSFVGDTVLDPFWGVGNTTLAALQTHRSSIGFEVEHEYFDRARDRFAGRLDLQSVRFHDLRTN